MARNWFDLPGGFEKCARPVAEQIKERVIADQIIKSDETSARVKGRNWWQWVFVGLSGVYHHIRPTRSAARERSIRATDSSGKSR